MHSPTGSIARLIRRTAPRRGQLYPTVPDSSHRCLGGRVVGRYSSPALIAVLVTEIQPAQVLGLERLFRAADAPPPSSLRQAQGRGRESIRETQLRCCRALWICSALQGSCFMHVVSQNRRHCSAATCIRLRPLGPPRTFGIREYTPLRLGPETSRGRSRHRPVCRLGN